MLEVTAAEYLDGHRIRIAFSNGKQGTVDLTDALWGPMFEPLRDLRAFQKFEVSPILHTIRWENDADLAPEYLYQKMVEQTHALEPANKPFAHGEPSPPAQ